ncbi:DUF4328 domain-containing protein [Streptomyces sp. NPDC012466]|uniref:DUF4328 domain-containing protein n=1 Tax=Streptomyces sp. NPDC012466 TaxID=3364835 RepID=UPI0036E437AE
MIEQKSSPTAPAPHPVRGAALVAIGTLALAALAWVTRAVWHLRLAAAGEPASGPIHQGGGVHRPLNTLEDSYHLIDSVGSAVTAVCAIAFLFWLDRMRDNAKALSGAEPRYSYPWLWLGWIVPVVNLWIPRGLVADVHRSVFPERRLPAVVNWWWGLWLAGLAGGVGLIYADDTDEVIARAYDGALPLVVADLVIVAAAGVAALMISTLTTAQQRRVDELAPAA